MTKIQANHILLFALAILLLAACGSPTTPEATTAAYPIATPPSSPYPAPDTTPTSSDLATQPTPLMDVSQVIILRREQMDQPVALRVGQALFVANPNPSVEWQIDYVGEILQSIPALEGWAAPEEQGWYFQAIAPGQTDLAFSSLTPCSNPPCPPASMRMVFSIEVKE